MESESSLAIKVLCFVLGKFHQSIGIDCCKVMLSKCTVHADIVFRLICVCHYMEARVEKFTELYLGRNRST